MFWIGDILWRICFVSRDDPILYNYKIGEMSVAVTDFISRTIYISDEIDNDLLKSVLIHELYHCYEFSKLAYDLPTFEEEYVANFMSYYSEQLLNTAYELWDYYKR